MYHWQSKNSGPVLKWLLYHAETINTCVWLQMAIVKMGSNSSGRFFQVLLSCLRCFPVVLFIVLNKVALICESVDEILKCDRSNESNWAVLSCGAVYYTVQGDSNL